MEMKKYISRDEGAMKIMLFAHLKGQRNNVKTYCYTFNYFFSGHSKLQVTEVNIQSISY